ncbi:MAG: MMPL family transporter [Chloroflexi bacterium]|nr:MMPL family transporter [Chloroflexota bacterium]
MFRRLGHLVYRFRWPVIILWVALFALGLLFAPRVSDALKGGGYTLKTTEAAKGMELLQRELGYGQSSLTIVFSSTNLPADDPRFLSQVETALADLSRVKAVSKTITYASSGNPSLISEDKTTTYAIVMLDADPDTATSLLPEIQQNLRSSDLNMVMTGLAPVYADVVKVSERDLRKAEILGLPLALLALVVVFGSLVAAGLPVAMGGISVAITLALIYFIAQRTNMSIFVMNMVSMLGLGIAIDYSLFIVSRFREELRDKDVEQSLTRTMATAGKAVAFSGSTVFIGLMGLVTFKFVMLRSLGIGGALVVLISLLAALTLVPAILAVLGLRVNTLSIIPQRRLGGGFWQGLATTVMRYPGAIFIIVIVFLLATGSPFLRVKLGSPDASILPPDVPSRQGFDIIRQKFGTGELTPILIAIKSQNSIFAPGNIAALYDYTRAIEGYPGVKRVTSLVDLAPRLSKEQYQALYSQPFSNLNPQFLQAIQELSGDDTTLVQVTSGYSFTSDAAQELVKKIRATENPFETYVSGSTAENMDLVKGLYSGFPRVLFLVMGLTFLALLFLFGSVVLPLKAILMNSLSILASYGALVFIFQEGHFGSWLHFSPQGYVEASLPILLFCVLFGLSMDYEVFLLTRVKEVYDTSGDNTLSVAQGLRRTGGIITSAALIIIIVAGSFAISDIVIIKALGVGMAIAIFLDATIVRALLVPATMRLLGNLNWWAPSFIKKALGQKPLE